MPVRPFEVPSGAPVGVITSATPRARDANDSDPDDPDPGSSPFSAKMTENVVPSPTQLCAGVSRVHGAVAESASTKPKLRATTALPTSASGSAPLDGRREAKPDQAVDAGEAAQVRPQPDPVGPRQQRHHLGVSHDVHFPFYYRGAPRGVTSRPAPGPGGRGTDRWPRRQQVPGPFGHFRVLGVLRVNEQFVTHLLRRPARRGPVRRSTDAAEATAAGRVSLDHEPFVG